MHIMQHEIKLACFNVRNLVLPGITYYENMPPYTQAEYDMKIEWIATQLDQSNADIIGLQEIFSPESIPHILEKTKFYRDACYIALETENFPQTPNVVLITRVPIAQTPVFHSILPNHLTAVLPGDNTVITHFSRPVLQATVIFPNNIPVNIIVVHLKSKKPDYPENNPPNAPLSSELGSLRSLIKRGTEALGIRYLLTHLRHTSPIPLIVMGDFNDFSLATSTQIITGQTQQNLLHSASHLLYNCYEIQTTISYEEKNSFFLRGTDTPRIDHILISEEFTVHSQYKLGKITHAQYFIQHLLKDRPEISDHGLLTVTVQLK